MDTEKDLEFWSLVKRRYTEKGNGTFSLESDHKKRKCLRCGKEMNSAGKWNRICHSCSSYNNSTRFGAMATSNQFMEV